MQADTIRRRGGLHRAARRLREGALTVGFLGGSITDARPGYNWPEPALAWLQGAFPGARLAVENAAIGATGSDLAAFRVRRDIIDRGCDLVFVEYAVNDHDEPPGKRARSREGLLRQLLAGEGRDVVLAYTYNQPMYRTMMRGEAPPSIADFEELAAHYDIPSVWMGLHALREVMAGRLRWEDWLPDGLHPSARGSQSYADAVAALLEVELHGEPSPRPIPAGDDRPPPRDPACWERVSQVPLDEIETRGPWLLRRWVGLSWIDRALTTAAVGARLSFSFVGRGVALGLDFGTASAAFRYRLDGGEWREAGRDRPEWCPEAGWYRLFTLAEDLPAGAHAVEVEVVHGDGPRCAGANFNLALVGVIE